MSDGIINRQDFTLLFENEQKKHFIPVEVTDQINFYGNVTLTSGVLQTFSSFGIKASFFDRYGHLVGTFLPEKSKGLATVILKQSQNYLDETLRKDMARKMEIAGLHNIRANLRYYEKKHKGYFQDMISKMSEYISKMNTATSINEMMLIYNFFSNIIWRMGMDPGFGVVHASNRRSQSLNLDFADIFKPIVIDRIIFAMVNKKILTVPADFETLNTGVYLSVTGKKIFLEMYEEKLNSRITVKGAEMTYRQLMESEVGNYKRFLIKGEKYKPYKYY